MSQKFYSIHEYPRSLYRTWEEAAKRILKIVYSSAYSGWPLEIESNTYTIKNRFGNEFSELHIVEHLLEDSESVSVF